MGLGNLSVDDTEEWKVSVRGAILGKLIGEVVSSEASINKKRGLPNLSHGFTLLFCQFIFQRMNCPWLFQMCEDNCRIVFKFLPFSRPNFSNINMTKTWTNKLQEGEIRKNLYRFLLRSSWEWRGYHHILWIDWSLNSKKIIRLRESLSQRWRYRVVFLTGPP